MFSHIVLGSNDLEKSKRFYDAILAPLGAPAGEPGFLHTKKVFYNHNGGMLILSEPLDGQPATAANGGTIGFAGPDAAAIDAWHAAGLANGGSTCEDPPGARETAMGKFYLAYLRDPDGNKLCGFHPMA